MLTEIARSFRQYPVEKSAALAGTVVIGGSMYDAWNQSVNLRNELRTGTIEQVGGWRDNYDQRLLIDAVYSETALAIIMLSRVALISRKYHVFEKLAKRLKFR